MSDGDMTIFVRVDGIPRPRAHAERRTDIYNVVNDEDDVLSTSPVLNERGPPLM